MVRRRNADEREETRRVARQSTQGNLDRHTAAIAARQQEKKDNAQVAATRKALQQTKPKGNPARGNGVSSPTQLKLREALGRIGKAVRGRRKGK